MDAKTIVTTEGATIEEGDSNAMTEGETTEADDSNATTEGETTARTTAAIGTVRNAITIISHSVKNAIDVESLEETMAVNPTTVGSRAGTNITLVSNATTATAIASPVIGIVQSVTMTISHGELSATNVALQSPAVAKAVHLEGTTEDHSTIGTAEVATEEGIVDAEAKSSTTTIGIAPNATIQISHSVKNAIDVAHLVVAAKVEAQAGTTDVVVTEEVAADTAEMTDVAATEEVAADTAEMTDVAATEEVAADTVEMTDVVATEEVAADTVEMNDVAAAEVQTRVHPMAVVMARLVEMLAMMDQSLLERSHVNSVRPVGKAQAMLTTVRPAT